MRSLELFALDGVPLVQPGHSLPDIVVRALEVSKLALQAGDVLVLAQKIVSKSEGRYVSLAGVTPSTRAQELAKETNKDPRLVEVILRESNGVVRKRRDVLVVEHKLGWVLANAGVDASNVACEDSGDERVLLLPENPDASAQALRDALRERTGVDAGVVINDSWGRAWRMGTTGTALGVAGIPAFLDLRGREDLFGRKLRSSELGVGDELAAAASLLMGQAGEGRPVVLARGFPYEKAEGRAADLVRPKSIDLFR